MANHTPSQQNLFFSEPETSPSPSQIPHNSLNNNLSNEPDDNKLDEKTIDISLDISTDILTSDFSSSKIKLSTEYDKSKLAPMLRQYVEIKEQYPNYLLLFQVGDFFEVFFEDAVTVSDSLSIRLTSRDKDQDNPIPMCGVPIHAFDNYLPRLLTLGFSCVVVEQVEDASQAKGLVKREITRIVTPGVRLDGEGLDEKRSNYLSAIIPMGMDQAILFAIEVSTGMLIVKEASSVYDIENILSRYAPREILLPFKDVEAGILEVSPVFNVTKDFAKANQVKLSYRAFSLPSDELLQTLFNNCTIEPSLREQIILDSKSNSAHHLRGLSALLSYVQEVSLRVDVCISGYSFDKTENVYVLDTSTRRNLELCEASYDGDRKYSVIGVIDKTKTAAGGRLLQDWLLSPLSKKEQIDERLDAVSECISSPEKIEKIRQVFSQVRDMERLSSRIAGSRATPYDFGLLRASLETMPQIIDIISDLSAGFFKNILSQVDIVDDVLQILKDAFVDELPPKLGERDVIRDSYHPEILRLRNLRKNSQSLLNEMELRERENTSIQNLKIRHNSVFGYYIEISKGQLSKVPESYIRKQTLTNAERFITPELKTLEQEIFSSKSRLLEIEKEIISEVRAQVSKSAIRLQKLARHIAVLDVIFSFAYVSVRNNFCRPEIIEDSKTEVISGRHPIVELVCGQPNFIPNDVLLNTNEKSFAVLTGPNMGGKSTYLRQLGIIQVLSQCGCFVPAKKAVLGIADRIFTRIGSGDALAKGESTFMVEMKEAANIIRNATNRSLVLIDEVGRGTATADGLSLATAIAHWLINKTACRTVFATHFHELTELPSFSEKAFCLSVGIVELKNRIEFTHRIEHQASKKSYGLHVAKLAGIPEQLIREANTLLNSSSCNQANKVLHSDTNQNIVFDSSQMEDLLDSDILNLLKDLKELSPESITPLKALELIYEFNSRIKKTIF